MFYQPNYGGFSDAVEFSSIFVDNNQLLAIADGFAPESLTPNLGFDMKYIIDPLNAGGGFDVTVLSRLTCAGCTVINGNDMNDGTPLFRASFPSSVVPIPAAVWLFGSALAGLGWMRRKQTA